MKGLIGKKLVLVKISVLVQHLSAGEDEASEGSSSEESWPAKKAKTSCRVEAESYPIDFMNCETTQEELESLRAVYGIPDDVELRIPSKFNTLS